MSDIGVIDAMRALGLLGQGEAVEILPLAGGVSADVYAVRMAGGRKMVVKRSIPRLRVRADWRAPVERDAVEVAWLKTTRAIDARLAPEVIGWSREAHLIVLAWVDGPTWKQELIAGRVDPAFAGAVGRDLARLHAATAGRAHIAKRFPSGENFRALRIDPFLLYTADRHPDVGPRLRELVDALERCKQALIWGDASPKNILVGAGGPVFLDAETATIGDPAFDVAFCLTHLLLKSVWLAPLAGELMASFEALRSAYLANGSADPTFSERTAALIGALLLARVDGKSPAGYLSVDEDGVVRRHAKAILARPNLDLGALPAFWRDLG